MIDLGFLRNRQMPHWLIALVGYFFLTLAATYPLVRIFDVAVLGGGDSAQNLWNLWWGNLSIRQGNLFPFATAQIYYPNGVSLAYHTLGPVNLWMGSFLQSGLGLNLPATYNVLTVLTFVISAIGMHWLVYALTRSHSAAFVAVIVFVFSPIRMSRLWFGNLNLYSTQFIPFALLFAVQTIQTGRRRRAVWCGVALVATAGLDLYLALGTALVILVIGGSIWGWAAFHRTLPQRNLMFQSFGILVFLTMLLGTPFVLPLLTDAGEAGSQGNQLAASVSNSADLLSFIVPDSATSSLFKRLSTTLAYRLDRMADRLHGSGPEKSVFVGYSVWLLLWLILQQRLPKDARPWLLGAGFFVVLALGPTLYVGGQAILAHMPYEWISHIWPFSMNRSPSRFALFAMLCLAVFIGYGIAVLEKQRNWRPGGTLLVALLIFGEYWIAPIRIDTRFFEIPSFYTQVAAHAPAQGSILDVPIDLIGAQGPAGEYMLFQTLHQRPIISGYIARTPATATALLDAPFYHTLRARIYADTSPFVIDDAFLRLAPAELDRLQVEYVILHRWALTDLDFDMLRHAFSTLLSTPIYEDDQITVWLHTMK